MWFHAVPPFSDNFLLFGDLQRFFLTPLDMPCGQRKMSGKICL